MRRAHTGAIVTVRVRDDPEDPDPGLADLYASFPDATDLEPWLTWAREAGGPVLYLGIGSGRLAVPLLGHGVHLVGVDAHPGMLGRMRVRAPDLPLVHARIETLDLGRGFPLVIAPSNILVNKARLRGAARHLSPRGRLGLELMNPYWLAAGAGGGVRVISMTDEEAHIEVQYRQGFVQEATVPLIWPDQVEEFLATAGLALWRMAGSADGLESSTTFTVLARADRDAAGSAGMLSRNDP